MFLTIKCNMSYSRNEIKWEPLDLSNVPKLPGVYGFRLKDKWLYIGRSMKLSRRLNKNQHIPLKIALELYPDITLVYCLHDCPEKIENFLIRTLKPEWNGGTARWGSKFPCCDAANILSLAERKAILSLSQ